MTERWKYHGGELYLMPGWIGFAEVNANMEEINKLVAAANRAEELEAENEMLRQGNLALSVGAGRLQDRAERLEAALRGLVNKLEAVFASPEYGRVFDSAFAHGVKYDGGPQVVAEMVAAKALLAETEAQP